MAATESLYLMREASGVKVNWMTVANEPDREADANHAGSAPF
jgi:hypothetical protein